MSDYILPEIVTEILKRLPVKSLLRFRSVCKQWCTLISSHAFMSEHLASSTPNSRILVRYYSRTHQKEVYNVYDHEHIQENRTRISFPFHDVSTYFSIVGYCHGLLCLFGKHNYTIVLWNPSIKRALTLPSPAYPYNSRSLSRLGFGFCSGGNEEDYKVVKLDYPGRSRVFVSPKVEVFSLSSGVWRQIDHNVECCINDNVWSDAFFAGTVHWVAFKNTKSNHQNNVILKFALSSEEFCELALPGDLAGVTPIDMIATTVEGKLSVLHKCFLMEIDTNYLSSCEIWVMKEYNNVGSWTRLFKVNLRTTVFRVMGVRRDGEMVLYGDSGELVIFDPNDGAVTETGIFCTDIAFSVFFDRYVESLLLLGKGKEVQGREPESDSEDVDGSVEQAESITVAFKTPEIFFNNSEASFSSAASSAAWNVRKRLKNQTSRLKNI